MEGDRILAVLESGCSWELVKKNAQVSLPTNRGVVDPSLYSLQNYLKPVFTSSLASSHFPKYEKFSLQLLKKCVDELKNSNSLEKPEVVLHVAQLCVKSLEGCTCNSSNNNLQPFVHERLFLQLAKRCFTLGKIKECVKYCEDVQTRLITSTSVQPEKAPLLHSTFELLWRAVDKGGGVSGYELLSVYEKALQCAVSSGKLGMAKLSEYCMKAEHCFLHSIASTSSSTTSTTSSLMTSTTSSSSHVQHLSNFHQSVLPLATLLSSSSSNLPCQQFVVIFQYLLHRATHNIKMGGSGCGLEDALVLLEQHETSCDLTEHLTLAPQATILQVRASLFHMPAQRSELVGIYTICGL